MNFKIGQKVSLKDYTDAALWCNLNDAHIEQKGEDYTITKNIPYILSEQDQIAILQSELSSMDYKGQKYIDGEYTNDEWDVIKSERQSLRQKIRDLQSK